MIQVVKEQKSDYYSFIEAITRKVKEKMGEEYSVRIYKVTKNNALELDSLVLLKEGVNCAPNIYLNTYYEAYQEGISIKELADRLCNIYQSSSVPEFNSNFTYSFDEMKQFLVYRLVSYDRNKKLLEQIPHMKYLDLAITFHCLVRDDEDGIGTIRITNEHITMWNVTLGELHSLASKNTKRLFPYVIRSMEEVIQTLMDEELGRSKDLINDFQYQHNTPSHNKMYILSNQKGINGAACMLYEDVLRNFSNQIQSDFFLLPSSIHEIILIPYQEEMKKEILTEMVQDVNRTQVAPEEVLSDRVYFYSRENNAIIM
jgi:hypothetical protein